MRRLIALLFVCQLFLVFLAGTLPGRRVRPDKPAPPKVCYAHWGMFASTQWDFHLRKEGRLDREKYWDLALEISREGADVIRVFPSLMAPDFTWAAGEKNIFPFEFDPATGLFDLERENRLYWEDFEYTLRANAWAGMATACIVLEHCHGDKPNSPWKRNKQGVPGFYSPEAMPYALAKLRKLRGYADKYPIYIELGNEPRHKEFIPFAVQAVRYLVESGFPPERIILGVEQLRNPGAPGTETRLFRDLKKALWKENLYHPLLIHPTHRLDIEFAAANVDAGAGSRVRFWSEDGALVKHSRKEMEAICVAMWESRDFWRNRWFGFRKGGGRQPVGIVEVFHPMGPEDPGGGIAGIRDALWRLYEVTLPNHNRLPADMPPPPERYEELPGEYPDKIKLINLRR